MAVGLHLQHIVHIFDLLNMEYKSPEQRKDGRSVVSKIASQPAQAKEEPSAVVTEIPDVVTEIPAEVSETPVEVSEKPVVVSEKPAEVSEKPVTIKISIKLIINFF